MANDKQLERKNDEAEMKSCLLVSFKLAQSFAPLFEKLEQIKMNAKSWLNNL